MRIAILLADNDDTDLSKNHPDDGEKFRALMGQHRPDWTYASIPVKDDVFPDSASDYQGYVITGSPSSVNDDVPWIIRLKAFIRELDRLKIPTVGACFGHQAIAAALGGRVGSNPDGWGLGIEPTRFIRHTRWMDPPHAELKLYSAHKEQVLELPDDATVLGSSPVAPVGAFAIGQHIFTTQHHPEITPGYMIDLVEIVADLAEPEAVDKARETIKGSDQGDDFAGWMVRFFELPR